MRERDLDGVLAIEEASFPVPWSRESFRFEMRENPYAGNVVLKTSGLVVGYACFWILDEELKINNIAIHPDWRGRKLGKRLLRYLLDLGRSEGCAEAALEVRPSNEVAREMYRRHGFEEVGRRKGYYRDTHEDAILMVAKLAPEEEKG